LRRFGEGLKGFVSWGRRGFLLLVCGLRGDIFGRAGDREWFFVHETRVIGTKSCKRLIESYPGVLLSKRLEVIYPPECIAHKRT